MTTDNNLPENSPENTGDDPQLESNPFGNPPVHETPTSEFQGAQGDNTDVENDLGTSENDPTQYQNNSDIKDKSKLDMGRKMIEKVS